jgi:hypothetical protein
MTEQERQQWAEKVLSAFFPKADAAKNVRLSN